MRQLIAEMIKIQDKNLSSNVMALNAWNTVERGCPPEVLRSVSTGVLVPDSSSLSCPSVLQAAMILSFLNERGEGI